MLSIVDFVAKPSHLYKAFQNWVHHTFHAGVGFFLFFIFQSEERGERMKGKLIILPLYLIVGVVLAISQM